MKRLVLAVLITAVLGVATIANANLEPLGGGLIYDTDLGITWYDFAYKGATGSGVNWDEAMDWAEGLTVGGASDWRLPSSLNPDGSGPCRIYNCTGSEMGHLYYTELGNKPYDEPGWGMVNVGPFNNLQPPYVAWSGTEDALTPDAWFFNLIDGGQIPVYKPYLASALAVHSGKVSPVPIPAAVWLLGSGLLGLIGLRRKYLG